MSPIVYEDGSIAFRQKVLLSVVSNRPIRIRNIRSRSRNPGVTSAEVDFLKLINEISNGTIVKVNDTGGSFTAILCVKAVMFSFLLELLLAGRWNSPVLQNVV